MYWDSISFTSLSAAARMVCFCGGISMSCIQMEIPARPAIEKPVYISLSANTTVSLRPHLRNEALISLEISFFFKALSTCAKSSPGGRISDRNARPTTVETRLMLSTVWPWPS